MKKIIILGGRGDGIVLASTLEDLENRLKVVPFGFLNDTEKPGTLIEGIPVRGRISDARKFLDQPDIFFMAALLRVKQSYPRSKKLENLNLPVERFFTLVHPQSTVSRRAKIGFGTFIGPHANVMPNAVIGNHCSLRASANVGHDCLIGHHCYIGPNATLSGKVRLEDGVHIGPNACIKEGTKIGAHTVVGLGSTVLRDLPAFAVAYGSPAKVSEIMVPTEEGNE